MNILEYAREYRATLLLEIEHHRGLAVEYARNRTAPGLAAQLDIANRIAGLAMEPPDEILAEALREIEEADEAEDAAIEVAEVIEGLAKDFDKSVTYREW